MKPPHSLSLYRITSPAKRSEVLGILRKTNANHNERTWLVFFLKYLGYSADEVFDILDKYNLWKNYDKHITKKQIYQIFNRGKTVFHKRSLISKNIGSRGWRRIPLSSPNGEFFEGALNIVVEFKKNFFSWNEIVFAPQKYSLYRTIEGENHILYVIDIDSPNKRKLPDAWDVTKQLMMLETWDWAKFSGSRGFHLIKKLSLKSVSSMTYEDLLEKASLSFLNVKNRGLTFDRHMFHQKRLIRGFSINLKTGLYSIPVYSDDKLKDILELAKDYKNIKR